MYGICERGNRGVTKHIPNRRPSCRDKFLASSQAKSNRAFKLEMSLVWPSLSLGKTCLISQANLFSLTLKNKSQRPVLCSPFFTFFVEYSFNATPPDIHAAAARILVEALSLAHQAQSSHDTVLPKRQLRRIHSFRIGRRLLNLPLLTKERRK